MKTAGFGSPRNVKRVLQAALYYARKRRLEREAQQKATPPPTGP